MSASAVRPPCPHYGGGCRGLIGDARRIRSDPQNVVPHGTDVQ